jgi:hypothetical protein
MTGVPVDLDKHRGMAAQKATEIRRLLKEIQADQAAMRARQEELEAFLGAAPAATWVEVAAKACYLLQLFATSLDAEDPRRQKLIAGTLEDLARLSGCTKEHQ